MDDEKNTVRQQKCTFIVSFAREKRKRMPLLCFIFVHYRTCSYFVEIRMELKGQQNTVKSSLHSRHIYIGSLLCVRKSFFLPACLLLLLLMLLMLVLMKSRWALNKVCIIVTDSATEEVTISKILIWFLNTWFQYVRSTWKFSRWGKNLYREHEWPKNHIIITNT